MIYKTLNESFNSIIKEALIKEEDNRSELRIALEDAVADLRDRKVTNLKAYEVALQEAIEKVYPDLCWWEVTDCQIFDTLFFDRLQPEEVIDCILDNLKIEDDTTNEVLLNEISVEEQ